jgi:hypothetical protein
MATPAAPAAGGAAGGGMAVAGFLVIVGLLVIVGIAVKLYDRKRKRDAEAVHLQAQISDALMREPALAGLVLTPTASVPAWGSGPAAVDISGEVSDARTHELVLRIAREEASRIRPDVHIEDRIRETQRLAA